MYTPFVVKTLKQAWRIIRIVIGATILIIGIALIFLPGPAFVVIPIGLAILATEFVWARKLLKQVKDNAHEMNRTGVRHYFRKYLRRILKKGRSEDGEAKGRYPHGE